MAKKEVFEWMRTGRKSVGFRRGRAGLSDNVVFQRGHNILRGIFLKKEEGRKYEVGS